MAQGGETEVGIDAARHPRLEDVHPSPLSAPDGCSGNKPASTINRAIEESGSRPIDWRLPA